MTNAPNRVSDGSSTLEGGVDGSRSPSLIASNKMASAVNTTARGGFATCRPGFNQRELDFGGVDEVETLFETSHCQGAVVYQPVSGAMPFALLHVAGRLFKVRLDTYLVTELTPAGEAGNSLLPYVWFKQAEQYMIGQDGQSLPWIFDGTTARRALVSAFPDYEVPVGTVMEYAFGRLVVARDREYVIGDIVNGPTEVYQFTENAIVAEGGAYTVPIPGKISCIRAIASLDNGVGQGPLTVHTPYGIVTARVDQPRSTWKDIRFQQVALLEHGSLGQDCTSLVNSDLWFRAEDGWRSLLLAVRYFGEIAGNTPNSTEIREVLKYDDTTLLGYGSSILFDNRLISTVSPSRLPNAFYHRGMTVLDFDLLGSLQGKLPPAWEGVWSGINPVHLIVGDFDLAERAFAVCRNDDGGIELWEISKNDDFDNGDQRIQWQPTFKSFSFNSPRSLKRLEAAEFFVDQVRGTVDFQMEYRPDQYPCWDSWREWQICEVFRNCATGDCTTQSYKPGYRPRMSIGEPPNTCDSGGTKALRFGYEFQPRMTIVGKAALRGLIFHATNIPEPAFAPCV